MASGWRHEQNEYNSRALGWLAKVGGARLWGRGIVVVFCGIAAALDGHAAARGRPAPKGHGERRAVAELRLPRPVDPYDSLYTPSLRARYNRGYAMAEKTWCEAARCHKALAGGIPAQ